MIELIDLTYEIEHRKIIKNLTIQIPKGSFVTVLGPSGSGKTTLLEMIYGLKDDRGKVLINGMLLNPENLNQIRSHMSYITSHMLKEFQKETILSMFYYFLENDSVSPEHMQEKISEVIKQFEIIEPLDTKVGDLNYSRQQYLSFAFLFLQQPDILLMDDTLDGMDEDDMKHLFSILKNVKKESDMTIIHATSITEHSLCGKEIILFNDGMIEAYGKKKDVYEEEKKWNHCQLSLPFMVELSHKLKYYGLVNKTIYNMSRMVNHLWK